VVLQSLIGRRVFLDVTVPAGDPTARCIEIDGVRVGRCGLSTTRAAASYDPGQLYRFRRECEFTPKRLPTNTAELQQRLL
jgi:hypothetical protein